MKTLQLIALAILVSTVNLRAEDDPPPEGTTFEVTVHNTWTNAIRIAAGTLLSDIWVPANSSVSLIADSPGYVVYDNLLGSDWSGTAVAGVETHVSYLGGGIVQGVSLSRTELTRQQLINAAGNGLTAGLPVSGAIMAFLLVRRAWTLGDKASIE